MKQFRIFLYLLVTSLSLLGCEEVRDVKTPIGGYNTFKDALEKGNADGVWSRLSKENHEFFNKKFETLKEMDHTIAEYLPPTDHAIARRQAGTVMLEKATDGESLFKALFDTQALQSKEEEQDWAVVLGKKGRATFAQFPGVEIPKIAVAPDEKSAVVDAPGIQIAMVTQPNATGQPEWFVDLIRSGNAVKNNLAWIETNQEALDKTVDDLIEERKASREALIAKLMGFKVDEK